MVDQSAVGSLFVKSVSSLPLPCDEVHFWCMFLCDKLLQVVFDWTQSLQSKRKNCKDWVQSMMIYWLLNCNFLVVLHFDYKHWVQAKMIFETTIFSSFTLLQSMHLASSHSRESSHWHYKMSKLLSVFYVQDDGLLLKVEYKN
jgi:hypothetical protein